MSTTDITTLPLSSAEEVELNMRVEAIHSRIGIIKENWRDIGEHLAEIRDRRLYRATHSTMEAFIEEEFGFSRQHAHRMIDAAKVAEIVSPMGDIPNERQARELVGLEPAQARETYQRAMESTGGKPTAQALAQARADVVPPAPKPEPARRRRAPLPDLVHRKVFEIVRVVDHLAEYRKDDRWPATIAKAYGAGGIGRAMLELAKVYTDLNWAEWPERYVPSQLEQIDNTIALLHQVRDRLVLRESK